MSTNSCPFCENFNPTQAKFCSACGGALHLVPCPRCGAVSDVTATACYQCHGHLPGRGTGELDLVPAVPEISKPSPRRLSRVIAGVAILAAVSVLSYYSYRQGSLSVTSLAPAVIDEASGRGDPAGAGVIRREAVASGTDPDNSGG